MRIQLALALMAFGAFAMARPAPAQETGVTGADSAKGGVTGAKAATPRKHHAARRKSAGGTPDGAGNAKSATDATAAKAMTKNPEFKARNAVIPP